MKVSVDRCAGSPPEDCLARFAGAGDEAQYHPQRGAEPSGAVQSMACILVEGVPPDKVLLCARQGPCMFSIVGTLAFSL